MKCKLVMDKVQQVVKAIEATYSLYAAKGKKVVVIEFTTVGAVNQAALRFAASGYRVQCFVM